MSTLDKNLDYSNPFTQSNKRMSPPTKQSQKLNHEMTQYQEAQHKNQYQIRMGEILIKLPEKDPCQEIILIIVLVHRKTKIMNKQNPMNPKTFANHLIRNSMNHHQGDGSYEKMIENKVFQFLNGFFANQQNQPQRQPQSHLQQQQQMQSSQHPLRMPNPLQSHISHGNLYNNRSVSPIMNRTQNNEDLNEIKSTTYQLSKDMKMMRKLVEELSMSLNEKDAEIIKLNMHLGDEKKKFQNLIRKQSQKSLMHNGSTSSLLSAQKDDSSHQEILQQLREENQQLSEISQMKKFNQDLKNKHKDEIKKLEEARHQDKQRQEAHIIKLENFNKDLQKEIKRHQDEVEKALKIHRANESLMSKNDELKQYIKKLNSDIDQLHQDRDRESNKYHQLLKHAQMLGKNNTSIVRDDGPCKSCLNTLQEKEQMVVEMENFKRELNKQKQDNKDLRESSLSLKNDNSGNLSEGGGNQQSRQNQILIQQIEQQYKQQIEQKQQELDLKDDMIRDLQKTIDELKAKDLKNEEEMKRLQTQLTKNNFLVEKNAVQLIDAQQKEAQLTSEIKKYQVTLDQLAEELEIAKNPKKKKK
ncbi:UNKNOWN [Stylonychia lemnae]|uniref:Uncharacterized protein n=1 Tax=Stylonychia lemnae TaxID=5949 RepID=A0A078B4N5_STYLE|nr:UNKNOWN [Stylonychia lemnae]|eukprot:CDW88473.1 UNKNOWN [Stylonychia lemnae]